MFYFLLSCQKVDYPCQIPYEQHFVLQIFFAIELKKLFSHFEFLEGLDGEVERSKVEKQHRCLSFMTFARLRQLNIKLTRIVINQII